MTFNELKKNLKKDFAGLHQVRVALLGDSATQFLHQALRGTGFTKGLNLHVFESDYDQIEGMIVNASSELYSFGPEFIVVFESSQKLLKKYDSSDHAGREHFADDQYARISTYNSIINAKLKAKIIWLNYPEIDDSVFGSYANKRPSSFLFQQRKLNYLLSVHSSNTPNFFVCDLSSVQNKIGRDSLFSPSIYVNSESVISIDALPMVAERIVQIVEAILGKIKKCLILDLDNTLWGGVIGDDGTNNIKIGNLGIGKAFTEFQRWIKKMKDRGIILCVCSKNTEAVAREPFEKHPDMVLRIDDFAVFTANWNTKVENIREIQKALNIGYDSMVFLDDNPFERNMVREAIPGITVPELPGDPAHYLEFIYGMNLFETASYSSEDSMRTEQYRIKAQIAADSTAYENEEDYLRSLSMESVARQIDEFGVPRIAQLSQRSNQFNLRTVRYSESDLRKIIESECYASFSFTLTDKYGDNGTIGAIVLKNTVSGTMFIESWFMSCRVLKRGMEAFMLNVIVDFASKNGIVKLVGEYLPTEKNALVRDHYKNLGFTETEGLWELDVNAYRIKHTQITMKEI